MRLRFEQEEDCALLSSFRWHAGNTDPTGMDAVQTHYSPLHAYWCKLQQASVMGVVLARHVALWRATVVECEVVVQQQRQRMGASLWKQPEVLRLLVGDSSGARSQLSIPFRPQCGPSTFAACGLAMCLLKRQALACIIISTTDAWCAVHACHYHAQPGLARVRLLCSGCHVLLPGILGCLHLAYSQSI